MTKTEVDEAREDIENELKNLGYNVYSWVPFVLVNKQGYRVSDQEVEDAMAKVVEVLTKGMYTVRKKI